MRNSFHRRNSAVKFAGFLERGVKMLAKQSTAEDDYFPAHVFHSEVTHVSQRS